VDRKKSRFIVYGLFAASSIKLPVVELHVICLMMRMMVTMMTTLSFFFIRPIIFLLWPSSKSYFVR
jgi:hypothetical protein